MYIAITPYTKATWRDLGGLNAYVLLVPAPPKVEEAAVPAAVASAPNQNGNCAPPETPAVTPTEPPAPAAPTAPSAPAAEPAKADAPRPAAANPEPPRRVRVPPGGFSSGLW
ncbi:hypothetical protein RR48_02934 [Papilio machaon]|uniref:Uncharacterized protein n=1 Tax=Papilio machaon TaxID=76193 RepID=A0A0N1ICQ8_PAPMA|nr:hypothetical protein RR48_02934 [Papilio machaon]